MGEYTTINPSSKEKRREHDLYPTPEGLVKAIFNEAYFSYKLPNIKILDVGCGEGVWGKVAREKFPKATIVGVELRKELKSQENVPCYDQMYLGEDFLAANTLYPRDWQLEKYDLIIGNPPYHLAEEFIRTSFKYLFNGDAAVVFLLRQAFLASMKRYNGLWKDHFPSKILTCSRRPSFYHADTGSKSTDGEEYAVYFWPPKSLTNWYHGGLLNWEY